MTEHIDDTPEARTSRKAHSKPVLTRLSAAAIARRTERQRPQIARTRATDRDAQPSEAADQPQVAPTPNTPGVDPNATSPTLPPTAPAKEVAQDTEADGRSPAAPGTTDADHPALTVALSPTTGVRQMTIWEDATDVDVIAAWVTASTRRDRLEQEAEAGRVDSDDDQAGPAWQVVTPAARIEADARRGSLRDLTTRDDLYLVQQVRSAVIDLVLEHPFHSEEADRRLVALGIRFGVWTLSRTAKGEFDPFRDLTEDRIAAFVRTTGVSPGSENSYASALRRLAAGPTIRHRGKRRKAVAPHTRRVEDGLWVAADAYAEDSWQHADGKTLLSLSFGAGALAEEINAMAPENVLVDRSGGRLRVSVRLMRGKAWVRDVPVLEPRYAEWLASRAAQVAGHTYLFKPDRVNRRNAINDATHRLAETNRAFERFKLNAARNTWAVAWLQAGVPFAEWANAAGVGPGTHLPTDLLAHLPTPEPAEVEAAFRDAALRHGAG